MTEAVEGDVARVGTRRCWPVSEKRRIVELTLEPGASAAEIARASGVNANQVFKWRREYERGELVERRALLLPVSMVSAAEVPGTVRTEKPPRAAARSTSSLRAEC
jgi:transposase-like protein